MMTTFFRFHMWAVAGRFRPAPAMAAVMAAAVLAAMPQAACAQNSDMKFPSFNSVAAKPQGIPAAGGPEQAPAAKPVPKPKKAKSTSTQVAAARPEASPEARAAEAKGIAIAVLVDDEPITGYEIDQRQRLLGMSANVGEKAQANFKRMIQDPGTSDRLKAILGEVIKSNQGKSREQIIAIFEERKKQFAISMQKQAMDSARSSVLPTLRKAALDELIDERLKIHEAKRLSVLASEDDVSRVMHNLAEKNKMNDAQFAAHLQSMGTDTEGMRTRFRAALSWNDVIRKQYGYQVSVSGREVDRLAAQSTAGEDQVELQVQRITLAIPEAINQKLVAGRMAEADAIRSKYTGCKNMQPLAGMATSGKFEELGWRKPSTLTEPTKSLLVSAKDGDMLPPVVGGGGVELYAVCARQVVKADDQKRTAAMEELRSKEFEMFAKRHISDLRERATIDYRQPQ